MGVTREEVLPQRCPDDGLVNLHMNDAEEIDQRLGDGRREWSRTAEIEVIVQAPDLQDRIDAMDALHAQIGAALYGNKLSGLVAHIELSAPVDADEIPMDGVATLKGTVIEAVLYYETSNNPMELQS